MLACDWLSCVYFAAVSSCITTYKKTPPPVPPRSSTKPFISITAQSSTESAQDAYMDGPGHRHGDTTLHSALSNSTESIDSMKALTAAIEAANAQVHGPASQHVSSSSTACPTSPLPLSLPVPIPIPVQIPVQVPIPVPALEGAHRDALRKGRCLSIGIQVREREREMKRETG